MKTKKILSLALAVLLIVPVFSSLGPVYAAPSDIVVNLVSTPPIKDIGDTGFFAFNVKYSGMAALRISTTAGSNFTLVNDYVDAAPAGIDTPAGHHAQFQLAYLGGGQICELEITVGGDTRTVSFPVKLYEPPAPAPSSDPPPVDIDYSKYIPALYIANTVMPTLDAGKTGEMNLTIGNSSSAYNARNFSASLSFEGSPADGIILDSATNLFSIEEIPVRGARTVTLKLKVSSEVRSGVYRLNFAVKYFNAFGYPFTDTLTLNVSVRGVGSAEGGLSVQSAEINPSVVDETNRAKLTLTLKNSAGEDIKDLRVMLTGLGSEGVSLVDSFDPVNLGALGKDKTGRAVFSVYISPHMSTGNYPLSAEVSYKLGSGQTVTETLQFFIQITRNTPGETPGPPSDRLQFSVSRASIDKNVLTPGDTSATLTISLVNTGRDTMTGVRVALDGLSGDLISLAKGFDPVTLGSLGYQQSGEASFSLYVAPSVQTGNYPLAALITCKDASGAEYTERRQFYVQITRQVPGESGGDERAFSVTSASFAQAVMSRKQNETRLSLSIANVSSSTLSDVTVTLSGLSSEGISIVGGRDSAALGTLGSGRASAVSFNVFIASGLGTGNFPLGAVITYRDGAGVLHREERTFFVQLTRPQDENEDPGESEGGGTPRLIVRRFGIDRANITAGEPFEFTFELYNTAAEDVGNIKVTLISAEGVYFPSDGSNVFYIETIGAYTGREITLLMTAKQDAEQKIYPLVIRLDYEDRAHKPYSDEATISYEVKQPVKFAVTGEQLPMGGYIGMPMFVYFNYVNKGRSTIYNLSVSIECEGMQLEGGEQYIGNIPPGYASSFESSAYGYMEGEFEGLLVITFEDASGNAQRLELPFFSMLMAMDPYDPGDDRTGEFWPGEEGEGEGEDGGDLLMLAIWITLGVLVLAGVIVLIVLLNIRKKKREAQMYEYGEDGMGYGDLPDMSQSGDRDARR